jgi:hypothetical protein
MFVLFLFSIIFKLTLAIQYTFLLNSQNWSITDNYNLLEPIHHTYNLGYNVSRYIVGYDRLINVDYFNKNDKNLWYFKSPTFDLQFKPKLLKFSLVFFAGNFSERNELTNCVSLCSKECYYFDCNNNVNAFVTHYVIPIKVNITKNITLTILGDWTKRNETIGLDNVYFI